MHIESKIEDFGPIALPQFTGQRVMMMPFLMEEPRRSIPDTLAHWRDTIEHICHLSTAKKGVGYLTIDEALVRKGETHRRPGLHVDGMGTYGGGGGGYAANGMFLATSHLGCLGYPSHMVSGEPGPDGDCEHLRKHLFHAVGMQAQRLYWCSPMAVHEAIPMEQDTYRQLIRVSMPSDAPYHREYTPNPTGVVPPGVPAEPRPHHMMFRPS